MRRALKTITQHQPETDLEVLRRSLNGDKSAFEQLVKRYQSKLFSVAVRLMKDRDLASELVQESFFKAYKNLASHSGTGSVKGWLTRITVNTCLNEIRKRSRLVFGEHSMEGWLAADEKADPSRKYQAGELREKVRDEVSRLTPARQAVLTLAALGYTYEEMAEATESSVSQVKSELFRARKHLRETLKEYRQ